MFSFHFFSNGDSVKMLISKSFRNYLFLFSILISSVISTKPKISEFAKSQTRPEKSKLLLHCSLFEGTKPVRFEWKHNDRNILHPSSKLESSRVIIEESEDVSVLKISNLRSSDSGNYSCFVSNAFGSDVQSSILIVKGLFS